MNWNNIYEMSHDLLRKQASKREMKRLIILSRNDRALAGSLSIIILIVIQMNRLAFMQRQPRQKD